MPSKSCFTFLLHNAIQMDDFPTVEQLLDQGIDVNDRDNEGNTALHIAAKYNRAEIIRLLLKRVAALNASNGSLNTPLHVAIIGNAGNAVLALAQYPDLFIVEQNNKSVTPVHLACYYGRSDFLNLLLSKETIQNKIAILNIKDIQGMTPLHCAFFQDKIEIINTLIEHGAYINAINYKNQTALHLSAKYGYETVDQQLLNHGAATAFVDQTANDLEQLAQDIGEPILNSWSEAAKWL